MVVTTAALAESSADISGENINQCGTSKAKNSPKIVNIKRHNSRSPNPGSFQDDDLGNRVSFYIDDETTQILLNPYDPKFKKIPGTPVEIDFRKLATLRGSQNLIRHASDVGGLGHCRDDIRRHNSAKISRHQSDIIRYDSKPRVAKQKSGGRNFSRQLSEPAGYQNYADIVMQKKLAQRRGSAQSMRSNLRRSESSMSRKSNNPQLKLPRKDLPPKERRRRTTVIVVLATFLFLLFSSILVVVVTLTHASFHQDDEGLLLPDSHSVRKENELRMNSMRGSVNGFNSSIGPSFNISTTDVPAGAR